MNYKGFDISDFEKNRIKDLYSLKNKNTYVFEACISLDNRFFILQDEVFDIKDKKYIGYIWESIDIFKNIFNTVTIDDSEYIQLQENWKSLPILESKKNLYQLRDLILEFDFFKDTWLGRKTVETSTNVKDSVTAGIEGLKEFGVSISTGEWSEILSLLKKGVIWILRKLKSAAYSTAGIIVDAILIATGIGKGFQMGAWGLITALDAYQIMNNDWPEGDNRSPVWKYLDLGFDLLGLVFAGVAAKGAKAIFKPLSNLKPIEMAKYVSRNPKMKSIIQKIYTATKTAGSKLKELQSILRKKWPNGANFINRILSGFEKLMTNLRTYCGQILSKSNLKSVQNAKTTGGVNTVGLGTKQGIKKASTAAGVSGGLVYGTEKMFGGDKNDPDILDYNNMINIKDIEFDYDEI